MEYAESWLYLDGTEVDHQVKATGSPNTTAETITTTPCIGGTHQYKIVTLHTVVFNDQEVVSGFTSNSNYITCQGPYIAQ